MQEELRKAKAMTEYKLVPIEPTEEMMMTIFKELKELDAKATSAIDNLKHNQGQLDMDGCMVSVSRQAVDETISFAEYSRNALPDLIRVIELAEEAFQNISNQQISANWQDNIAVLNHARIMADKALTEIRKLKGE